ncbi:hypothetical protein N9E03_01715 [bacterium]|nr:hypothetical protein [bacterium]
METTPIYNLFTLEQLQDYQQAGKWPLADSTLLSTKYADRWKVADRLFKDVNKEFFIKLNQQEEFTIKQTEDPEIPHKSFSRHYSGSVFSYDNDYMASPTQWNLDTEPTEFVERTKVYIYDWTEGNIQESSLEFDYFVEMHKDFKPVVEHYLNECYSDQLDLIDKTLYKLMIIRYNNPSATEENIVEHRKWNTERFGDEHFDETLGGLHLGENYSEFKAKNETTNKWEIITELTKNKKMWMHGEHAQQSGWIPTTHGMSHNPQKDLKDRYSIIFDLQARYK